MSTQVSTTDLSRVVAAITATQAMVNQVNNRTNQIQNQVETVDNNLRVVYNELSDLQKEFTQFVKEQRNANNFQRALTEIVRIRQELEQKFGKHAEARVRLRGILDSVDTGLLREHTIASCSEQIMLDTPKYWLSPCLVALAAWISNNKDLTEKAVKVALDRDVEKATLLFALVSRRTVPADVNSDDMAKVKEARQKACFAWLKNYFNCQNPKAMKESVIVLIDSWANDIFGEDSENICEDSFNGWMTTLENDESYNLRERQLTMWYQYYGCWGDVVSDNVEGKNLRKQYSLLAQVSPEFPSVENYVKRINAAPHIKGYFYRILNVAINKNDLINRLDEQLEALISEFDPEEEDLRKEELECELTKKHKGDSEKVQHELEQIKKSDMSAKVSLAQRLAEVVLFKNSKYAAARKTALNDKFLGKYVKEAYNTYITDQKENFPSEITIRHESWKGWSGKTADGSNSAALTQSLKTHLENCRDQEIAALNYKKRNNSFIFAAVLGVLCAIFLFVAPVVGFIALAAAAFFAWNGYSAHKAVGLAKKKINDLYAQLIDVGQKSIISALVQWQAILKQVNDFQNNPKSETLDLAGMQIVAAMTDSHVLDPEAKTENEDDNAAGNEADNAVASDMSFDDLESLEALVSMGEDDGNVGAEDNVDAELAAEVVEEDEAQAQSSLNQSVEFLKVFAEQFSTQFVLAAPAGYDFVGTKIMQDKKALQAERERKALKASQE